MRSLRLLPALCCLTLSCQALAQQLERRDRLETPGLAYRSFAIEMPYDWRGGPQHALSAAVWYPAAKSATETQQWIGAPGKPLFSAGRAALDAALSDSAGRYPLILLSHGSGGAALQMAWLGTILATHGYIAAAVNHPGNNAVEGYTARGFSTWWERARPEHAR